MPAGCLYCGCDPHRDRDVSDTDQKLPSSSSASPLHRQSSTSVAPVQRRRLRTPVWARSLSTPSPAPMSLFQSQYWAECSVKFNLLVLRISPSIMDPRLPTYKFHNIPIYSHISNNNYNSTGQDTLQP